MMLWICILRRFTHTTLFKHRRSKSKEADVQTPKDESEVHSVIDNLKKHNKRYKKELDSLEEAYNEKCQENFFLKQQLQIYMNRYGTLEEIEDMVEALTENSDNSEEEVEMDIEHHDNQPEQNFDIQVTTPEDSPEVEPPANRRPLSKTTKITQSNLNWIPPHLRNQEALKANYESSPDLNSLDPVTASTKDYAFLPVEKLTKSQVQSRAQVYFF